MKGRRRLHTILRWTHTGTTIAVIIFLAFAALFQYEAVTILTGAEEQPPTIVTVTTTITVGSSATSCTTSPCLISITPKETINVGQTLVVTHTKFEWIVRVEATQNIAQFFGYLAMVSASVSLVTGLLERKGEK